MASSTLAQRQGATSSFAADVEFAKEQERGAKHRQQQAVIYKADVPFQVIYRQEPRLLRRRGARPIICHMLQDTVPNRDHPACLLKQKNKKKK